MIIPAFAVTLALIQDAFCQQKDVIPTEITQADLDALDKKLKANLDVIKAWKNAGVDVRMSPIVFFEVRNWKKGIFETLPNPDFPFGISLEGSGITDDGLEELSRFSYLEKLNLSSTRISDKGLKKLSSYNKLLHLKLGFLDITPDLIKRLASLENLTHLDLSQAKVADDGLREISTLKNLVELNLDVVLGARDYIKDIAKLKCSLI